MSDLISRKDALKAVGIGALSAATVYGRSEAGMAAKREIERAIADLPSAQHNTDYSDGYADGYKQGIKDAQPEIIRCKDCKHWDGVDTCDVIDAPVWDNDFCSLAERRSHE